MLELLAAKDMDGIAGVQAEDRTVCTGAPYRMDYIVVITPAPLLRRLRPCPPGGVVHEMTP